MSSVIGCLSGGCGGGVDVEWNGEPGDGGV